MLKKLLARYSIIRELLSFLWKERLWWLIPMIIILILLGILMIFSQGSAIAPFIYTIF
ncbi:hypothetical protein HY029_06110 [Candidatus Gottesmanbacteria bacterium]|nr:hypothetical protein [Candidatus Gottesmanbacteria bacterium]